MSLTSNPKARVRQWGGVFTLRDLRERTGSRTTRRRGVKKDWRKRRAGIPTVLTVRQQLGATRRKLEEMLGYRLHGAERA